MAGAEKIFSELASAPSQNTSRYISSRSFWKSRMNDFVHPGRPDKSRIILYRIAAGKKSSQPF